MASANTMFLVSLIGVGFPGGPTAVVAQGIVCPRAACLPIGRFRLQH